MHPEERPPCTDGVQSDVLLPEVPTEKPPWDTLTATAEMPAEALPAVPSTVPPAEADTDLCAVALPPCPGSYEASACQVPSTVVLQMPAEQPPRLVPRGRCLIHNWQEEVTPHHGEPWGEMSLQNSPHRIPHADHMKLPDPGQPSLLK